MKQRHFIENSFGLVGVFALVGMCFTSECMRVTKLPWSSVNNARDEVLATVESRETQWMVLACISTYCLVFSLVNRKVGATGWKLHLLGLGLVLVAAFLYARAYPQSSAGTDALVFCFGLTLFQGVKCWRTLETRRSNPFRLSAALVSAVLLVFCLALAAGQATGQTFSYRGQQRWNGLWDNPNMSGVLMAAGVVVAAGWLISAKAKAENRKLKTEIRHWAGIALLGAAAVICSIGLVRSYCRGAWLGAVCGLAYLAWQWCAHLTPTLSARPTGGEGESFRGLCALLWPFKKFSWRSCVSWLSRNWLPVSAIVVSGLMLAYWNLRHTERTVTRRVASVANVNDFSSRNRVAAWEGALQMAAEKPWLGFGWNMQDQVYDELYRQPRLDAFRAIRTNDYFKLANTLGIPALACFVVFVGLSLMRRAKGGTRDKEIETDTSPSTLRSTATEDGRPSPQGGEGGIPPATPVAPKLSVGGRHASLTLASRAGVVVLLVSFWFDGADSGLFRLASSSLFWILLALGSNEDVEQPTPATARQSSSELRVESGGSKQLA